MPLPNTPTFTPLDPLPASELNDLVENDEALADGSAIDTNAVGGSKLATNAITLGYAEITSNFTTATSGSFVDVTGLSVAVTVPAGGRRIKITTFAQDISTTASGASVMYTAINEGATQLAQSVQVCTQANQGLTALCMSSFVPTAGAHTYKIQIQQSGTGTLKYECNATSPAFILVELI